MCAYSYKSCRELHERLRSLVGGAISRMAREKACKGHMASLESQLHLLRVKCLLLHSSFPLSDLTTLCRAAFRAHAVDSISASTAY